MSPKRLSTKPTPKKAPITVEMKKDIIKKSEGGARIVKIACELGKASFTITTILKKRRSRHLMWPRTSP